MIVTLIKRVLKLLKPFITVHAFKYVGKGVSLNDYYSQGHWSSRNSIKNKYSKVAKTIIEESGLKEGEVVDKFAMIIFYNSRHDPDNVAGFEKIVTDELKTRGNIQDDSRHYYKLFAVIPDMSLPMNTFNFSFINIHGWQQGSS